ncbi:unnamed protein product, partial [Closterium sp. Naga37s-1]
MFWSNCGHVLWLRAGPELSHLPPSPNGPSPLPLPSPSPPPPLSPPLPLPSPLPSPSPSPLPSPPPPLSPPLPLPSPLPSPSPPPPLPLPSPLPSPSPLSPSFLRQGAVAAGPMLIRSPFFPKRPLWMVVWVPCGALIAAWLRWCGTGTSSTRALFSFFAPHPSPSLLPASLFTLLVVVWVACRVWSGCGRRHTYQISLLPQTALLSLSLPASLFTLLVVVWVACGAVIAAWLLYWRHSQYVDQREEALGVWCKERALTLQQLVLAHAGQMQVRLEWVDAEPREWQRRLAGEAAAVGNRDIEYSTSPHASEVGAVLLTHAGQMQVSCVVSGLIPVVGKPGRVGKWDMGGWASGTWAGGQVGHGRVGKWDMGGWASGTWTLSGVISVMGKPGQGSKWGMGRCLNGSMWVSYLTRTAPTRPGNTGAVACALVRDAERPAFEKQYGSIRDNTLIVSARRPIYCPKILELTTLYATNGPSNIDMFQRYYSLIPLVLEGRHFYSWPYALANPLTHAGFDPSKSFELYDITDPASLFAIVSPVPPHAYFRPDDKLPYMHPSPNSETRPWEHRAVVPLIEMGAGVRRYEHRAVVVPLEMGAGVRKYEVWCRHTQPPSTWQSWGIPILIALFALLLVLLVLLAACLQRAKFLQTQQQMAEADRLRREADEAEASKSMFVACMSHELRAPMVGIIGMLDALADMGLDSSQLEDLLLATASAKKTLHLVNRVLDMAKLEAGKAVADETVIDVREWLDAALHWHVEAARSKGIE